MDQKSALEIIGRLSGKGEPLTMGTAKELYRAAGLDFNPFIATSSTDQDELDELQLKIKEAKSNPNTLIYLG